MDEARRYHFPFHSYWPSQSTSAQEADVAPPPPLSSSDIPRNSFSQNSTQNEGRLSSSADPNRYFSPPDASDDSNRYAELKEPQLPRPIGNQMGASALQTIWPGETDKEVYRPPRYPSGTPSAHSATSHPLETPAKRRICGVPIKWFLIIAGLAACTIIGLAVGLGVGLGTHHSTTPASRPSSTPAPSSPPIIVGNPNYDIGGTLSPAYYSTDGAFNGSGIALATSTFDESGYGAINLYFQYYDGTLRWIRLLENGTWQGGSIAEIITADAKNGSAIAAVAYAMNDTSTWHIFYISTDNMVRQKTFTNVTNLWQDGPINNLNVQANDKPMVGLQACWFGNLYGDSEYTHSPQFNDPNVSTTAGSDSTVGMHLFIGDTDTSFQQYGWLHGEDNWTIQDHWPNKNSQAGVGCYSWAPDTTVSYVFMLDLDNTLNIYWKGELLPSLISSGQLDWDANKLADTNSSLPANSTHPINQWTNSSIAIPDLHPSSSLGYTNYLYCQLADESINGYNISFNAENTAFVPGDQFQIQGLLGVPGTHLSVTSFSNPSGGASILAFYQTHGDDITGYSRDKYGGPWTGAQVTIPG